MLVERIGYKRGVEFPAPPLGEIVKELGLNLKTLLSEKLKEKVETKPQPLTLPELVQALGFEQDPTLQGIEYFILQPERTKQEIELLLGYYDDNAQIMFDKREELIGQRRTDKDALGLMIKIAEIRYKKGILTGYNFNFQDTRDFIEFSQEIDLASYHLARRAINALKAELAQQS